MPTTEQQNDKTRAEAEQTELEQLEDDQTPITVEYSISSYGADYPVDSLPKRLDREDIFIPRFQRRFVWTHGQASRFIESLLLGLPVPGVFLFKEPDTQRLMVVDGQQRLGSLQAFYDGVFDGKEFVLRGVAEPYDGKSYKTLRPEDRRRLDDAILHVTVFQQDEPSDDRSSIYEVFERLNTGGTPLQPQEIRACVYLGKLNDLLEQLATDANWQEIYGPRSKRKKDEEVILRFLALYYNSDDYRRPMKSFLNDFMGKNRSPKPDRLEDFKSVFEQTVRVAAEALGREPFRPERNINVAITEALLVGLAVRVQEGPVSISAVKKAGTAAAKQLVDQGLTKSGTTDRDNVFARLKIARDRFAKVPAG